MVNPQLWDYVQKAFAQDGNEEQMRSSLLNQGWKIDDINRAINEVKAQQSVPAETVLQHSKGKSLKILSGLVILLILAGAAYFLFSSKNLKKNEVKNAAFENSREVYSKLVTSFANAKSFEINGSLTVKVQREDAKSNFSGVVVLPESLKVFQDVENTSTYNDPENKAPKTKSYHYETIITDKKQFEKTDQWQLKGLSPMGNIDFLKTTLKIPGKSDDYLQIYEQQKPQWLVLSYADGLDYVGKEGVLFHYKIKPKNVYFGDATIQPQLKFQLKGVINAWDAGQIPTPLDGEVWIDGEYRVVKEKYTIGGASTVSDNLMNIEVNYNNYGKAFVIDKPIDTADLDKFYSDLQAGKDEKQAEKEYQEKWNAKNPGLASEQRDERRFNDMMIQTYPALEMYYLTNNSYPASLSDLQYSIGMVPLAPIPADGSCSEEQNKYKYIRTSADTFELTFCLGAQREPLNAGYQVVTEKGVGCIPSADEKNRVYYCLPAK